MTRYDIQIVEVIKSHTRLPITAQRVGVLHEAGEHDWGNRVLRGCNGRTMRSGETFLLFLNQNERFHAFVPLGGSALLANITSSEVAPIRASVTPGAVVSAAIGQTAADFLRTVRAAVGSVR